MNSTPINPIVILLAAILSHNIALTYILGMCPLIVISNNLKSAVGMSASVIFVVVFTVIINWPLYHLILLPTNSEIIAYTVFIITIAATVQLVEMILERFFPPLQAAFGIFLPLITVNCIVLAVSLFMVLRNYNYLQTIFFAIGSALGWSLAIIVVAAIREKLVLISNIPKALKGPGIVMVILGILSLGFMGFVGIVSVQ